MTTWILIMVVQLYGGAHESPTVAATSVVFHSQKACEDAAKKLEEKKHAFHAYCFEDKQEVK